MRDSRRRRPAALVGALDTLASDLNRPQILWRVEQPPQAIAGVQALVPDTAVVASTRQEGVNGRYGARRTLSAAAAPAAADGVFSPGVEYRAGHFSRKAVIGAIARPPGGRRGRRYNVKRDYRIVDGGASRNAQPVGKRQRVASHAPRHNQESRGSFAVKYGQ